MQQSENCEENFKIHFLTLIWTTKQGLANYVLSHAYKVHISTPNTYIHYINHFKCYNDHFHKYIKIKANTIKTVNQLRTKAHQMVLMLLFVFFISFKMTPLSSSPLFSPKLVSLITSLVFPNTSSTHKKNPHPPPYQIYQKENSARKYIKDNRSISENDKWTKLEISNAWLIFSRAAIYL